MESVHCNFYDSYYLNKTDYSTTYLVMYMNHLHLHNMNHDSYCFECVNRGAFGPKAMDVGGSTELTECT